MRYSIDSSGCVVAKGKWPRGKLAALKESIHKWEFIVKVLKAGRPRFQNYTDSCALCALYYDFVCEGCPVATKARDFECRSTPWKRRPTLLQAQAELKFLKSLLPDKK